MTYSVGFRAPSHQEVLEGYSRYLDNLTTAEERYADPDFKLQNNPGEITDQAIDRVQSILRRYSEDRELISHWFGEFMTEPKYPDQAGENSVEMDEGEIRNLLSAGIPLCRNEGSRFAFHRSGDLFILFVDGKGCACSPDQIPSQSSFAAPSITPIYR